MKWVTLEDQILEHRESVESLPALLESRRQTAILQLLSQISVVRPGMWVNRHTNSTWEVEARGSAVQGHPPLHSRLKVTLS